MLSIGRSRRGVSNTTTPAGALMPFLYCTETKCPECGWLVPMAPSWVIGRETAP